MLVKGEDENVDLKKVIKSGFVEEEKLGEGAGAEAERRPSDCNQWIRYPPLI